MSEVEEQLSEIAKEEASVSEFLPGELFYTERMELPGAMSAQEAEQAIETLLEAHAPFPVESLNFGAVVDRSSGEAFVYAASRERIESFIGETAISDARYPCFLPFLGFRTENPCLVTAVNAQEMVLLVYDKAGSMPSEVQALSFEGDAWDVRLLNVCGQIFCAIYPGFNFRCIKKF